MRQTNFLRGLPHCPGRLPDVSWHSCSGDAVEWNNDDRSMICVLAALPQPSSGAAPNRHIMMLFHADVDQRIFSIPPAVRNLPWRLFVDTAAESPRDIYPSGDGPTAPSDGYLILDGRSMMVYVARDET